MALVNFGQPDDGIIQMAYVVEDIHSAIDTWVKRLRVGPWFLLDSFSGVDPLYRGRPTTAPVSLAMSFAGYGFHHWGVASKDFDRDLARYEDAGYDVAFHARVPTGGRVAYMDTTADLPGMVELIELGAAFDPVFSGFYRASIGWDGKDPVRPFG